MRWLIDWDFIWFTASFGWSESRKSKVCIQARVVYLHCRTNLHNQQSKFLGYYEQKTKCTVAIMGYAWILRFCWPSRFSVVLSHVPSTNIYVDWLLVGRNCFSRPTLDEILVKCVLVSSNWWMFGQECLNSRSQPRLLYLFWVGLVHIVVRSGGLSNSPAITASEFYCGNGVSTKAREWYTSTGSTDRWNGPAHPSSWFADGVHLYHSYECTVARFSASSLNWRRHAYFLSSIIGHRDVSWIVHSILNS